ncbi:hypothetical protein [Kroppenstedtia sanguinis]
MKARGRKKTLRLKLDVSTKEWQAAVDCLKRRVDELRMKVREGDRKGRGVEGYFRELSLLEVVLLQIQRLNDSDSKQEVDKK